MKTIVAWLSDEAICQAGFMSCQLLLFFQPGLIESNDRESGVLGRLLSNSIPSSEPVMGMQDRGAWCFAKCTDRINADPSSDKASVGYYLQSAHKHSPSI